MTVFCVLRSLTAMFWPIFTGQTPYSKATYRLLLKIVV